MDEDDDEAVPQPNINAAMKMVIQWATYHKDDILPRDDKNTDTEKNINISDWETGTLASLEWTRALCMS